MWWYCGGTAVSPLLFLLFRPLPPSSALFRPLPPLPPSSPLPLRFLRALFPRYTLPPRFHADVRSLLTTPCISKETFGRNEYRHYTYRKHEEVCRADAEWDQSHKEPRHRPLITEKHNHVSEYFSQFAQDKSECVLRILESRLGQENLLEILTRTLEVKEDAYGDLLPCMVTYKDFLVMANERVPQRWKELLQNWVECEGFAHFTVTLLYVTEIQTGALRHCGTAALRHALKCTATRFKCTAMCAWRNGWPRCGRAGGTLLPVHLC